jgi:hypothetical protein
LSGALPEPCDGAAGRATRARVSSSLAMDVLLCRIDTVVVLV